MCEYVRACVCVRVCVVYLRHHPHHNRLCIQIVKHLDLNNSRDCLVGMFDGGRNQELPKLIAKKVHQIVLDEINHPTTNEKFLKYSMLTAHRNLKQTGQKLGMSGALCHIRKSTSSRNGATGFLLTVANVGDVEAVLCRKGEAVLLTRKFVATCDHEEVQRVCKSDGIITEDGKVN
ncbi:hypothetical protein HELRODRAFT_91230, partial [Helobdella robusta]|uniref:protein-serine/threonine phosphatase n=1 Tax=Helobdella robusta TaxID=6412 RepID=T1G813_HELRO